MDRISFIDLFSGCGGFSLGFVKAGFRPLAAIDHDAAACETHRLNFEELGCITLAKDLTTFHPADLSELTIRYQPDRKPDIIVGGPPCQGWSRVGIGKLRSLADHAEQFINDPRNQLYGEFINYVRFFRPYYFAMENVPGMLSRNGQNVVPLVIRNLSDAGYRVRLYPVDAADYEIPQRRFRLIFIGARLDTDLPVDGLLLRTRDMREYHSARYVQRSWHVNLRKAIADLPRIEHGYRQDVQEYRPGPGRPSNYARLMRKGCDGYVYDHITRRHNDQDLRAFERMKQGMIYADLEPEFKRYRDDIFKDKYRKLRWDEPAGTITAHLAHDCYTHIHPEQPRTISIREAARIQSFPDSFRFSGNMGQRFRQIGNAVPPLLVQSLALAMKTAILKDPILGSQQHGRGAQDTSF